jgi:hypothetical protein
MHRGDSAIDKYLVELNHETETSRTNQMRLFAVLVTMRECFWK